MSGHEGAKLWPLKDSLVKHQITNFMFYFWSQEITNLLIIFTCVFFPIVLQVEIGSMVSRGVNSPVNQLHESEGQIFLFIDFSSFMYLVIHLHFYE